jgi:hypothetical protein
LEDLHFPDRIVRFDIVSLSNNLQRKSLGSIDFRSQTACHMVTTIERSDVDSGAERIFNNSRSIPYFSCVYNCITSSIICFLIHSLVRVPVLELVCKGVQGKGELQSRDSALCQQKCKVGHTLDSEVL